MSSPTQAKKRRYGQRAASKCECGLVKETGAEGCPRCLGLVAMNYRGGRRLCGVRERVDAFMDVREGCDRWLRSRGLDVGRGFAAYRTGFHEEERE